MKTNITHNTENHIVVHEKGDIVPSQPEEIIDATVRDIVPATRLSSFTMALNDSFRSHVSEIEETGNHEIMTGRYHYLETETNPQTQMSSQSAQPPTKKKTTEGETGCCSWWVIVLLVIFGVAAYGAIAGNCIHLYGQTSFCF